MNRAALILCLLLCGCAPKPIRLKPIDFAPVAAPAGYFAARFLI